MNTGLYVIYSKQRPHHRIPLWAKRIRKFIGDYLYYRKRNHSHIMAWRMARNTL
ncbi:MAG TPA: hypothetical protein VK149_01155 [Sideroxyarcus sp.]|nr:hypothetical protein [Sideroxyarcus sp.]